jgi:hypothetical protein
MLRRMMTRDIIPGDIIVTDDNKNALWLVISVERRESDLHLLTLLSPKGCIPLPGEWVGAWTAVIMRLEEG